MQTRRCGGRCAGRSQLRQELDPGGPLSATYTLVSDKAALDAAFDDIVRASTRVNCPGNIQSPGPWRRNATPQKTSGVLFCGIQEARPTVVWTDDDDLLVSTVQSGRRGQLSTSCTRGGRPTPDLARQGAGAGTTVVVVGATGVAAPGQAGCPGCPRGAGTGTSSTLAGRGAPSGVDRDGRDLAARSQRRALAARG